VRPRRPDDRDSVGLDLVGDPDPADVVAESDQARPVEDRFDGIQGLRRLPIAVGDRPLFRFFGVADPDPQQEPVELSLGQGEGPLELDRVLGCEHDERVRKRPRRPLDRDLPLLHRLEQRRLGPRSGPVDLVDQEDVRENRARSEAEVATLVEAGACDIDGEEVRRPLDPVRAEGKGACDRPCEERLAGPRDVLDEDVAVGEEGSRDQSKRAFGSDHGSADRDPDVLPEMSAWGGGAGRRTLDLGVRFRAPRACRPLEGYASEAPGVQPRSPRLRRWSSPADRPRRGVRDHVMSRLPTICPVRVRTIGYLAREPPRLEERRQASAASRRRTAGRIPP
jgi:hypothetical protein